MFLVLVSSSISRVVWRCGAQGTLSTVYIHNIKIILTVLYWAKTEKKDFQLGVRTKIFFCYFIGQCFLYFFSETSEELVDVNFCSLSFGQIWGNFVTPWPHVLTSLGSLLSPNRSTTEKQNQ